MQKVTYRLISVVLLALALVFGGCSDFDEMKAQRLFNQAETLFEKGDETGAEVALADLVAKYPNTQAGLKGRKQLQYLKFVREKRERMEFSKILDSYEQVLNGYRSVYSEYPRSIASLDESGYFFDLAYLQEITPENYQVYLFLQEDGSGYSLWCVRDELERGYAVDATKRTLVPFDPSEVIEGIKARFRAEAWEAKVVTLSPL
jgi:hypothetical protein